MEKENKILIFRTSITKRCDIKRIGKLLAEFPQIDKWNVDFEDWEKILRIECMVSLHSKYRKYSGIIIFLPANWNKTEGKKSQTPNNCFNSPIPSEAPF